MSSISSVLAPPPVQAPATNAPPAPQVTADANANANDAGATQPVVQAPLPPGQGTRVDQLM
jgi:hypothetical protein